MALQKRKGWGGKIRRGPSGIHIFYRDSGANVLLDELRVPPKYWSPAPRQVSVALTNACELSCPYCYAPKKPAALDFEQLKGWLAELDANGCLGIGLGGGEPTLYRRFADVCHFAAQETDLAVTFTTHGHNLDEQLIAALHGNVHFVRVSMDGVGATYETLRGRPFESLLHTLRLVKRLAPFGVNFVVNEGTLPDLDRATTLAEDLGAVEFLILPEQPVNAAGGIDDVTTSKLRVWIDRYRGSVPLTISEAGAEGMSVINPLVRESGLQGYAHIDAWGIIKRSSYDRKGVIIGARGVMRALGTFGPDQGEG